MDSYFCASMIGATAGRRSGVCVCHVDHSRLQMSWSASIRVSGLKGP